MLKINTVPVGMLQTNCYTVAAQGSKRCLLIDPGDSAGKLLNLLQREQLIPAAILLTHGHFDHDGAAKAISEVFDCPVYIHEAELSLPAAFPSGRRFYTHTTAEGDTLELAGLHIRVLHTPGHTPGSLCYLIEDALFAGDTLFAGGCGRTDFPGGDPAQMLKSLLRLAAMEQDLAVYPGHGESTTLAAEKRYNPYLRGGL